MPVSFGDVSGQILLVLVFNPPPLIPKFTLVDKLLNLGDLIQVLDPTRADAVGNQSRQSGVGQPYKTTRGDPIRLVIKLSLATARKSRARHVL